MRTLKNITVRTFSVQYERLIQYQQLLSYTDTVKSPFNEYGTGFSYMKSRF
jgi:hypothetical protein